MCCSRPYDELSFIHRETLDTELDQDRQHSISDRGMHLSVLHFADIRRIVTWIFASGHNQIGHATQRQPLIQIAKRL